MATRRSKVENFSFEDSTKSKSRKTCQGMYDVDAADGLQQKIVEQLRRHRYLQVIFFIIILLIDIVDVIADWLFYVDVSLSEQGLVYGVPDQKAVHALLFFSIVGSLTFIFESANLGKEIFTGCPWLNTDMVSAIVMWIEDLPQIAISIYIALCREDPISVFQLTKAAVVILGIIIRIVVSSVRYCSHGSLVELKQRDAESQRHVTYRVFIMLGLLINMGGAIAIFIFTQTSRDLSGHVIFEVPDTVFEDRFHDARYIHNVSVYFHHPTFDFADNTPTDGNGTWMRLMSINSIRHSPEKQAMFGYEFEDSATQLKMMLWENRDGKNWEAQECHTIEKNTKLINSFNPCVPSFLSASKTSFIFKFSFIPPSKIFRRLVVGDITFNVKVKENGNCHSVDERNITNDIKNGYNIPVVMRYYRTTVSDEKHVIDDGNSVRFYENEKDLIDIKEVWQTGWMNCETQGSLAPHLSSHIDPPCDLTP